MHLRPRPGPLQRLLLPVADAAGIRLYCKRDDLYTPAPGTALQGNKVRKLEPFLRKAFAAPSPPVLVTFGGAYSNHAAALATAGQLYGLPVHLLIRGLEVDNPVLGFCAAAGAKLERLSRAEYRLRSNENWLLKLRTRLASTYCRPVADVWMIPEGGTSPQSARNVGAVYRETHEELGTAPDFLAVSAGTGGSAAGIIQAADPATRVEVYPALKGGWMGEAIVGLLSESASTNWSCVTDYHYGGYGKFPTEWTAPSPGLSSRADLGTPGLPPLEPIYTAKLFSGVLDRIARGIYPAGSSVVLIHTGGIY